MSTDAHSGFIKMLSAIVLIVSPLLQSSAQETEGELAPLPAAVAANFDGIVESIGYQKQDIQTIESRLGDYVDNPVATQILERRRDEIWTAMFDATTNLAVEVIEQRGNGFDVSDYTDGLAAELSSLPTEASAATERIQARVEFPTGDLPPNEFVYKDQVLFQALEDVDAITAALITYTTIAEQFALDTESELAYLNEKLADTAENRSIFLELGLDDVKNLRVSVATLPNDETLSNWLSAAQVRVQMTAASLQDAINLMNLLGMETRRYRQQVLTVTGEITTDILDVGIVANLVKEWSHALWELTVTEGPRLIFRLILVALIIFAFYQLSKLVQKGVEKAMNSSRNRMSYLLRRMITSSVRNLVMIFGILIGISQLGISLAPLLAGLGIAGFIIGFALQDSLSNFASGVMILMYRPFDVGDVVDAAGVRGRVSSMSLVNTTFMTLDNQRLVVPNNMIWQTVITNVTAQRTRRVDLVFGISYSDDIEKAEKVLLDIIDKHEACLDDPEPVVKVHELGESSVNFIVRPWVKTADYWDSYWDLTKQVKLRFDEEGISIPFPQRDVHVIEPKAKK